MAHIITDKEVQSLIRIAYSIINPVVKQGLIHKQHMNDAAQELLQEAIRLSDGYEDKFNADFITYAHGVMKLQIFRVIRKTQQVKFRILTDAIPIESLHKAEDSDKESEHRRMRTNFLTQNEDKTLNRRMVRILLVRLVLKKMPSDIKKICNFLIDGYSITDISKITGLSRKSIRIKISAVRKAMIDVGITEFVKKYQKFHTFFKKTGAKIEHGWR